MRVLGCRATSARVPRAVAPIEVVAPCDEGEVELKTLAGELCGDGGELAAGGGGGGRIVEPWSVAEGSGVGIGVRDAMGGEVGGSGGGEEAIAFFCLLEITVAKVGLGVG